MNFNIGDYFHSFDSDNEIVYQGRILKVVKNDYVLCETYDFILGFDIQYIVFHRNDLDSFNIYKTRKEMLIFYYTKYKEQDFDSELDFNRRIKEIKSIKEEEIDFNFVNKLSYAEFMPAQYGIRFRIDDDDDDNNDNKIEFVSISASDWEPPKRKLKAISDPVGIFLMQGNNYSYCIDWERISSSFNVLHWLKHLIEKTWFDMEMLEDMLICLERKNKISFHNESPIDRKLERRILSKSVRYKILQRDNFKCKACGSSVSDGAKLEVDHILPLSRGGTSDPLNLQTLCLNCNRGKRCSY